VQLSAEREGDVTVRIYVKQGCPYSAGALRLLDEKGIRYEVIDVTDDPSRRAEMESRSAGQKTTPQVFFGDRHVGGFSELQELDRRSGIRTLLAEEEGDQPAV
jgi:glutaredoxin 3